MRLTILGSNAAIPSKGRFPTSQILEVGNAMYMIDCGEGTQIRIGDFGIKRGKISRIFISHLHGDHTFGLTPLISSYSLNDRTAPLHIHSPEGLEKVTRLQLEVSSSRVEYPLHFHVTDPTAHQCIFENDLVEVFTIPLRHRVPTNGYLFRGKRGERKIISEKIQEYNLNITQIKLAKKGKDIVLDNGKIISNNELTMSATTPKSYCFCSDTLYSEEIIPYIKGIDVLYHEATFARGMESKAIKTMHSTAYQAAMIARDAGVKKLIIGHFSTRFHDLDILLNEAREIFPNTELAIEGRVFEF